MTLSTNYNNTIIITQSIYKQKECQANTLHSITIKNHEAWQLHSWQVLVLSGGSEPDYQYSSWHLQMHFVSWVADSPNSLWILMQRVMQVSKFLVPTRMRHKGHLCTVIASAPSPWSITRKANTEMERKMRTLLCMLVRLHLNPEVKSSALNFGREKGRIALMFGTANSSTCWMTETSWYKYSKLVLQFYRITEAPNVIWWLLIFYTHR